MIPVTSLLRILTWVTLGILVILVLLGNGFIIAMNGHQWLQNKKMVPCNFLLISLSTSRFLLQMDSAMSYLLYLMSPETYLQTLRVEVVTFIWMFLNMMTFWCATWLSVFYCVKVTNFANRLFLWVKLRINVLAPRLLGMSIVVSTVFFFPSVASYFRERNLCKLPRNISQSEVFKNSFSIFSLPQFSFISINFSLTQMASILLLISLWKHTRNLKKSGVTVKDLSTQVHIKVMKFLLVSFFFYVLYFSGIVISVGNIFEFGRIERLASDILLSLYTLIHSIILIFNNPKLKEAAAHFLNIRLHKG